MQQTAARQEHVGPDAIACANHVGRHSDPSEHGALIARGCSDEPVVEYDTLLVRSMRVGVRVAHADRLPRQRSGSNEANKSDGRDRRCGVAP